MGKYMRKAKLSGEVAVMEVAAHQPSLGVRTRARALAAAAAAQDSSLAYLELRSRRLEKPLPSVAASKPKGGPPKEVPKSDATPRFTSLKAGRAPTSNSGSAGTLRTRRCSEKGDDASLDVEVSCAENVPEPESRERETTPCSLIRDSETIGTPCSTTRSTYKIVGNRRLQGPMRQNIPSSQEVEDFFVGLEKLQQQIFIEKYNFDPVNDHPLPGRYEWVELDS
ncbi:cyclin-dependent kinase inhibitor 5-like [Canna indica]|uniref:Cyclin-dependent kinase inhibitor 5-like n=1 Tax=Canna indica TaxID=4628 RepID=A0AAQ3KD01_9LILI|nr:cyclin-dependent kinase inhibitor 5-like [Canna indica]